LCTPSLDVAAYSVAGALRSRTSETAFDGLHVPNRHVTPASRLRCTPLWVAAYNRVGVVGSTTSARVAENRLVTGVQVPLPSLLRHACPLPTAYTTAGADGAIARASTRTFVMPVVIPSTARGHVSPRSRLRKTP